MPLLPSRYKPAAPAPWGEAIEVPEIVIVSVSLPFHAEVMPTPGAYKSNTEPKFEKNAVWSEISVAPTVRASSTRAGDTLLASIGLLLKSPFPAATAYVTPALIEFLTAVSIEGAGPPFDPRLILATTGTEGFALWSFVTQLTPARIASSGQPYKKLAVQTLTERIVTALA